VAVWGLAGFGLAWVLMNGKRVTWKLVVLALLAAIVVVGAFAVIDLYGGGEQTHLGRALVSASQGGVGELWTIVSRKAETNARVLTRTNWAYILIATLGFLALMRWRPRGDFAETLTDNPAFADAITVSLAAALIAYFTEDSGIVISALVVFYVGVALSWLMLSRLQAKEAPDDSSGGEVSNR
jgi:regulator of protease activity HflC (stomatin/prohibitin superfamily)